MILRVAAEVMLAFVALYPVVTAAAWIAGGLLFRLLDERAPPTTRQEWPGVTLLIPAFNERDVIGTCVRAALALDYPELEVMVLDDGSTDGTVEVAVRAGAGDPRLKVVPDRSNLGKAERLNVGFRRARHELVAVTDADTHVHRAAVKLLVERIERSPRIAAVAGAPHVTNRQNLLTAMQVLEAASVIGLIRRTQSLGGRVGVVAGVLGLFRRGAVLGVGGYRGEMATEDIDLSWRLLMGGWHTAYQPDALVGMQVPATLPALWSQRCRWARGQGEVLNVHLSEVVRSRLWGMSALAIEALASLLWIAALTIASALGLIDALTGGGLPFATLGLCWGIAVAAIATLQLAFALRLDFKRDRLAPLAFLLAPLFAPAFWLLSAAAALRSQVAAVLGGPAERRVVWDVPRDYALEAPVAPERRRAGSGAHVTSSLHPRVDGDGRPLASGAVQAPRGRRR